MSRNCCLALIRSMIHFLKHFSCKQPSKTIIQNNRHFTTSTTCGMILSFCGSPNEYFEQTGMPVEIVVFHFKLINKFLVIPACRYHFSKILVSVLICTFLLMLSFWDQVADQLPALSQIASYLFSQFQCKECLRSLFSAHGDRAGFKVSLCVWVSRTCHKLEMKAGIYLEG